MNTDTLGGIVRAIVAAIGGYFVGKGVIDASTATALAGAAATIAVAIWSVFVNRTSAIVASAAAKVSVPAASQVAAGVAPSQINLDPAIKTVPDAVMKAPSVTI